MQKEGKRNLIPQMLTIGQAQAGSWDLNFSLSHEWRETESRAEPEIKFKHSIWNIAIPKWILTTVQMPTPQRRSLIQKFGSLLLVINYVIMDKL